jgi:hypothetical protein
MKMIMKPMGIIEWFIKIRYKLDDLVIRVSQVTSKSEEKLAGNRMIVNRYHSEINGLQKATLRGVAFTKLYLIN